jgi:hypothetical protein
MAVGIESAGVYYLRYQIEDFFGKIAKAAIPLKSDTSDANVESIIGGIQTIINGALYKAEYNNRALTGLNALGTAVKALQPSVTNGLELTFTGADAANTSRAISRSVLIVTPKWSLIDDTSNEGKPLFSQTDLAALIVLLAAHMAYLDGTGTPQTGLTFNASESNFVNFDGLLLP